MNPLNLDEVRQYVQENIVKFHSDKLQALRRQNLKKLLKDKNPYLFRAKNLNLPQDLVTEILNAALSSSEEEIFGRFLEELAIFIIGKTGGGRKSMLPGIDLEFVENGVHYVVSVKSGPNWGNGSQQTQQEDDFNRAIKVAKQSPQSLSIQPVLGICYGKTRTNPHIRGAMKIVGQNFWFLISGNENLYTEIIEPLGVEARKRNEEFHVERETILARFTEELRNEFGTPAGIIDWPKLIEFTCGNLDMELREGRFVMREKKKKERKGTGRKKRAAKKGEKVKRK